MPPFLSICSIDIGLHNFAFVIEEFDEGILAEIENIPERDRYNLDGTPTEKMAEILDTVGQTGKILAYENVDLAKGEKNVKKIHHTHYLAMNNILDTYSELLDKCSVIAIERQMGFTGKLNPTAVKLAQHCYSYFLFRYHDKICSRKLRVIDFEAYHKTHVLGAPKIPGKKYKNGNVRYKTMEKPARKKWAVGKAIQILTDREDDISLKKITGSKKRDDFADCFIQLVALKYLLYVDNVDL